MSERIVSHEERIIAYSLRARGWDVSPPFDMTECEATEAGTGHCNIEANHLGNHRWMVEGTTAVEWPQEVHAP